MLDSGGNGDSKDISAKEEDLPLYPDHELRVGTTGQVAIDYKSRDLYEIIRERMKPARPSDPAAAVRNLIAHKQPANVRTDGATVLFDPDAELTLEARLLPSSGSGRRGATLVVQSRPEPSERAKQIAESGQTVLVLVPRGLPAPSTERLSGDWITNMRALLIGRSLPAMRAHDILCGIDILARQPGVDPARIHAMAEDAAGIWLLMAAAADPRIASVEVQRTPVSLRAALDAPVTRGLHDGVVQLGAAQRFDLDDLVKSIAPRGVTWTDPVDWMRNPVVRQGPPFRYTSFGH